MTTKASVIKMLRDRYDALREETDKMPTDGAFVIALADGSVMHPRGGIADAGMLAPIVIGGKHMRFETRDAAREELTRLKGINAAGPLDEAFVTTEGHACEMELEALRDLMRKLCD